MSNYMHPTPLTDATLTQENVPADAKATGDAISKKANSTDVENALSQKQTTLLETRVTASTDSNGNIYTNWNTEQYVVVAAFAQNLIAQAFVTSEYNYSFHLSDYQNQNIGTRNNVTVWVRYYKR
nr:MAG TPA: hypothetical protein [Caudoviricetes sp.]